MNNSYITHELRIMWYFLCFYRYHISNYLETMKKKFALVYLFVTLAFIIINIVKLHTDLMHFMFVFSLSGTNKLLATVISDLRLNFYFFTSGVTPMWRHSTLGSVAKLVSSFEKFEIRSFSKVSNSF